MSQPFNMTVARTDAGYAVFLEGRATMNEGSAFHEFVIRALDREEQPNLTLCVEACDYMDSTFLGGLVSLHKKYSSGDAPRFIVAASSEARARLLASARLDLILKLIEAAPACQGERVALPPPPPRSRDFAEHAILCHRLLAELGGPNATVFNLVADQLTKELEDS